jgi:hypothetical protein
LTLVEGRLTGEMKFIDLLISSMHAEDFTSYAMMECCG